MGDVKTNPYKTLIGQLLGWLHQLPVIGFNSGKYDLNVINPGGRHQYTRRRDM